MHGSSSSLVLLCAALLGAGGLPEPKPVARVPVLVELFTSEGCSSCPPADLVLGRLLAQQPVEGVEVLALSEHVDYWNRLGWRDPFSAALFSSRQEAYAHLASGRIYTPQAVIDGAFALPGQDERSLRSALEAARERRRGTLSVKVTAAPGKAGKLLVALEAAALPEDGELLVALVEDGLEVRVTAGENEGRVLPHTAVVRLLVPAGKSSGGKARAEVGLTLETAWRAERLRVVAFLQRPGGPVLAAGAGTVTH